MVQEALTRAHAALGTNRRMNLSRGSTRSFATGPQRAARRASPRASGRGLRRRAQPPEVAARRAEIAELTVVASRNLPTGQREALFKRELEGRSHEEIAAAIERHPGRRPRPDLPRARGAAGGSERADPLTGLRSPAGLSAGHDGGDWRRRHGRRRTTPAAAADRDKGGRGPRVAGLAVGSGVALQDQRRQLEATAAMVPRWLTRDRSAADGTGRVKWAEAAVPEADHVRCEGPAPRLTRRRRQGLGRCQRLPAGVGHTGSSSSARGPARRGLRRPATTGCGDDRDDSGGGGPMEAMTTAGSSTGGTGAAAARVEAGARERTCGKRLRSAAAGPSGAPADDDRERATPDPAAKSGGSDDGGRRRRDCESPPERQGSSGNAGPDRPDERPRAEAAMIRCGVIFAARAGSRLVDFHHVGHRRRARETAKGRTR